MVAERKLDFEPILNQIWFKTTDCPTQLPVE